MRAPAHRLVIEEELIDLHVVDLHRAALDDLGQVVATMAARCKCGCQRFIRDDLRRALRRCRNTLTLVGRAPPAGGELS